MASPQLDAPDIRVFEMVIKLAEEDERLRPGMSAEVEVTVEVRPDVLAIPLEAVYRVGDQDVVYQRRGGGFAATSVKLGERNSTAVVVTEGLAAGDEVALQRPADAK